MYWFSGQKHQQQQIHIKGPILNNPTVLWLISSTSTIEFPHVPLPVSNLQQLPVSLEKQAYTALVFLLSLKVQIYQSLSLVLKASVSLQPPDKFLV